MTDFSFFYRSTQAPGDLWKASWDIFISAFNNAPRIRTVFDGVPAANKLWILHREYGYTASEEPTEPSIRLEGGDEAADILSVLDALPAPGTGGSICIDITGMMRAHVIALPLILASRGVRRFDALYSEPGQYVKKESTTFSSGGVHEVRPIRGYEGVHDADGNDDLLVIGSGYDYQLIAHTAEHKRSARKLQLFGFPSLRPDMYQENVLQAYKANDAIGEQTELPDRDFFASASDAFAVAEALQEIIEGEQRRRKITNLYLSPLATKPQALGFALYWLHEWRDKAASIVLPFTAAYNRETTEGCSRIWRFEVELPVL